MAGTAVTFDGNSLQTASIFVNNISHESLPTKDLKIFALAHANRSSSPYNQYPSKSIKVSGQVVGSSIANLDGLLDTFRGYFLGTEKNLDIDYNGSTRRYIATVNAISIDRPGGLLYANFTIDFICSQPFGQNVGTTNALALQTGRTAASYTDPHTFLGTAPFQLPQFNLTMTDVVSSSTELCTNPGFEVNTTGWSSGGIGTFTRVTSQFHSGVASGQMVNAASAPLSVPSANTYGWELFPISGLVAGQTYRISLWVKGNAGGEAFKASSLLSTVQNLTLTTGWQQIIFTFTATGTTDQLYVWSTTASATWFLDDVSITQNASTTISIGNAGNGQQVNINRNWAAGDILVVDCLNKAITVNGTTVPFTGAFPEFPPGAQNLYYVDNFISRLFNEQVTYYPMFL